MWPLALIILKYKYQAIKHTSLWSQIWLLSVTTYPNLGRIYFLRCVSIFFLPKPSFQNFNRISSPLQCRRITRLLIALAFLHYLTWFQYFQNFTKLESEDLPLQLVICYISIIVIIITHFITITRPSLSSPTTHIYHIIFALISDFKWHFKNDKKKIKISHPDLVFLSSLFSS